MKCLKATSVFVYIEANINYLKKMKINSKKVLLWLYTPSNQSRRRVPYSNIKWLLEDLTAAGRQSLIRLMEERQWIFTDELNGESHLSISSYGRNLLEAEIPALVKVNDKWQGEWSMLLFLESPAADQSFRYLRTQLVKGNWLSLKRGVYLYPGDLPQSIKDLLAEVYISHVAVIKLGRWQFGDEQMIIGQKMNMQDLISVYSGIGREITKLLEHFAKNKELSDRQKVNFSSIFSRLLHSLLNDLGLITYYFPTAESGTRLLKRLQQGLS